MYLGLLPTLLLLDSPDQVVLFYSLSHQHSIVPQPADALGCASAPEYQAGSPRGLSIIPGPKAWSRSAVGMKIWISNSTFLVWLRLLVQGLYFLETAALVDPGLQM